MVCFRSLVAVAVGVGLVAAHPGQTNLERRQEVEERRSYLASLETTDLAHCAPILASSGTVARTISRRRESLVQLRKRAGFEYEQHAIEKRQQQRQFGFKDALAKDHRSKLNLAASWQTADWTQLGQNQSVVLHPETTEGPYYISGLDIRRDLREKEQGVTVHLDVQVIDIKTCLPVVDSAVEIWGCNATGVYSGISGGFGNGAVDPASMAANQQNKALRGIQISNKDGSAQFDTIFPGHYAGRTNHIHIMTHRNQTVLANRTIAGGTVNHVGQIYFDQSLIEAIDKTSAYKDNPTKHTLNKNDMIMATGTEGLADNVVNYVLLGDKVEDGIFAWMNFGVDTAAAHNPRSASVCGEQGCAPPPFDFWKELTNMVSGKGRGPPPMPNLPAGGIPGFEPQVFGLTELLEVLFGIGKGAKGAKGSSPPKLPQQPAILSS